MQWLKGLLEVVHEGADVLVAEEEGARQAEVLEGLGRHVIPNDLRQSPGSIPATSSQASSKMVVQLNNFSVKGRLVLIAGASPSMARLATDRQADR